MLKGQKTGMIISQKTLSKYTADVKASIYTQHRMRRLFSIQQSELKLNVHQKIEVHKVLKLLLIIH